MIVFILAKTCFYKSIFNVISFASIQGWWDLCLLACQVIKISRSIVNNEYSGVENLLYF